MKIGDRVRITSNKNLYSAFGEEGIITKLYDKNPTIWGIKLKNQTGYLVYEENLTLINVSVDDWKKKLKR